MSDAAGKRESHAGRFQLFSAPKAPAQESMTPICKIAGFGGNGLMNPRIYTSRVRVEGLFFMNISVFEHFFQYIPARVFKLAPVGLLE